MRAIWLLSLTLFALPAMADISAPVWPSIDEEIHASRQGADACGGRGLADAIVPDGPFLEACKRHDACYRSDAKDQYRCDLDFLASMKNVCNARYDDSARPIKRRLCLLTAETYFLAVNSKFGAYAYTRGRISADLTGHTQRRIHETHTQDEFELCANLTNTSNRLHEFTLVLHDEKGRRVDTEPDLYDLDVRAGQSATLCVDTDMTPFHGWNSIGDTYTITLRVDDPDHFGPFDAKIPVAKLTCEKAFGTCRRAAP